MNRGRGGGSGIGRGSPGQSGVGRGSPGQSSVGRGSGTKGPPKSPGPLLKSGLIPASPGSSGTPGTAPTDVVRPVLPPLYPPAPKVVDGRPHFYALAKGYSGLQDFYQTNYSVEYVQKKHCAFNVERYTDKYELPQSINPKLNAKVDSSRLPKELYVKNIKIIRKNPMTDADAKRKLDMLIKDESSRPDDSDEPKAKKRKVKDDDDEDDKATAPNPETVEDEEEEEVDEELDEGTDYMANYFDNGEDYLDEEDDALEDGAVF